jgi:hypothetical protein
LLQYLGAESARSLTLLPRGSPCHGTGNCALSHRDLRQRIARLPRQTLTAQSPKRMSLAGAQHKLLIVCEGEDLFEPVGASPSTQLLKPPHVDTDSYPACAARIVAEVATKPASRSDVTSRICHCGLCGGGFRRSRTSRDEPPAAPCRPGEPPAWLASTSPRPCRPVAGSASRHWTDRRRAWPRSRRCRCAD